MFHNCGRDINVVTSSEVARQMGCAPEPSWKICRLSRYNSLRHLWQTWQTRREGTYICRFYLTLILNPWLLLSYLLSLPGVNHHMLAQQSQSAHRYATPQGSFRSLLPLESWSLLVRCNWRSILHLESAKHGAKDFHQVLDDRPCSQWSASVHAVLYSMLCCEKPVFERCAIWYCCVKQFQSATDHSGNIYA
jgi:hypothetical protein